jgi:hypothetical protein
MSGSLTPTQVQAAAAAALTASTGLATIESQSTAILEAFGGLTPTGPIGFSLAFVDGSNNPITGVTFNLSNNPLAYTGLQTNTGSTYAGNIGSGAWQLQAAAPMALFPPTTLELVASNAPNAYTIAGSTFAITPSQMGYCTPYLTLTSESPTGLAPAVGVVASLTVTNLDGAGLGIIGPTVQQTSNTAGLVQFPSSVPTTGAVVTLTIGGETQQTTIPPGTTGAVSLAEIIAQQGTA